VEDQVVLADVVAIHPIVHVAALNVEIPNVYVEVAEKQVTANAVLN